MQTFTRSYFSLGPFIIFLPLLVVALAIFATLQMSKYKWVVHALAFAFIFFALPLYVWIGAILDPTIIEYPGPGDGFVYLLYAFVAVLTMIGYAVYAWLARTKSQAQVGSTV
jgi:hypothetical protein